MRSSFSITWSISGNANCAVFLSSGPTRRSLLKVCARSSAAMQAIDRDIEKNSRLASIPHGGPTDQIAYATFQRLPCGSRDPANALEAYRRYKKARPHAAVPYGRNWPLADVSDRGSRRQL